MSETTMGYDVDNGANTVRGMDLDIREDGPPVVCDDDIELEVTCGITQEEAQALFAGILTWEEEEVILARL